MSRPALLARLLGWATLTFMATAAQSGISHAQTVVQPTPPEHYTLDTRGVDLVSGKFTYQTTEVVIGQPGQGGLAQTRGNYPNGWRDSVRGSLGISGSTYTVTVGLESEIFTLSGGVFTPQSNSGATLTQTGAEYTFTTSSGVLAKFTTAYCFTATGSSCTTAASLYEVVAPNGETTNYNYLTQVYLRSGGENPVFGTVARLQSVTNNRGYQLRFAYQSNTMSGSGSLNTRIGNWLRTISVTGINAAVDYCAPTATTCSYTRTWPSVTYAGDITSSQTVTDQSGRVTSYDYTASALTGVRFPGSTSNDITVSYATDGKVAGVTDATGSWTYGWSDVSSVRTGTATGPLDQQTVSVSDLTIGRATSVTVATGPSATSTWNFTYDSQRRLQRTTNPEGDYVELTYDARGNVTGSTATPKSGSGLSPVTTAASYASTCSNPVVCNLPNSTTDARGNVTDYTWDSTHGGPLTITAPAPTSGAARPQVRYVYAAQTAYYKNSSGSIVAAPTSITLPIEISACATGTSCSGAANEVQTSIAYGATGVANNLLPTSVTSGSGDGALAATTAATYDPNGDLASVDGPLSGTGDTTVYRYDVARQFVGAVGPDPDGTNALLNRALRVTYSARGQVTLAEYGTTPGYTNSDWSNFAVLQRQAAVYDGFGRAVQAMDQSAAGTTLALEQISYDAAGRAQCSAIRMNPAIFGSLPTSACSAGTTGSFGPDLITQATFDAAGRVATTVSGVGTADAITEGVTYTANGRPQNLTDGNANVSIVVYDGFDRPARTRYPNATGGGTSSTDYEEYTYDAASNVTLYRNRSGQTFETGYDALNRPITYGAPTLDDRTLEYDNLGRIKTLYTTGVFVWGFNWTYDALGRQLTEQNVFIGTLTSEYDLAGRRTRLTWPDAYYAAYDYDLYGTLTAVRENGATSGAGVLATYGYDNLGRRTTVGRGNGVTTSYGYDAISRLDSLVQNPSGTAQDLTLGFVYDPASQIVSRSVSNNSYVYAPATGAVTYSNDGLNRVVSAGGTAVSYDTRGNITGGLGSTFGYDAENNLTTAGSNNFLFDPLGRLYRSVGTTTTRFLYDGLQAVAEYPATGSTLAVRHVPGVDVDDVVASYSGSGTTNRTWLLTDERQSVVGLADGTGAASVNAYDEYGVPASGNAGRFQYTGQMWLPEAGLYHYKARAYAPQLGRFMQTEPLGYGAGANLYAYVGNNPVNFTDPSGLTRIRVRGRIYEVCVDIDTIDGPIESCTSGTTSGSPSGGFSGGPAGGIFGFGGSGGPGGLGGGTGSYFGYQPPLNPITNDPAYAPFRAEVAAESARNAWMAEPIFLVMPTARVGRLGRGISRVCNCFEAGTDVLTSTGSQDIETIQVGDLVLSRDEVTGETAFKPVVALIAGVDRQIWEVMIETVDAEGSARRETVGTTDEHPWRLVGGDWATTAELYPGAALVTARGAQAVVISVTKTDRIESTYNFEIEGFHTYFVGAAGVWVHNKCKPSITLPLRRRDALANTRTATEHVTVPPRTPSGTSPAPAPRNRLEATIEIFRILLRVFG